MALKTLLICDNQNDRAVIEEVIAAEQSVIHLETVPRSDSVVKVKSMAPDLVWIHLDPSPVRGLANLAELKKTYPDVFFLTSYSDADPELVRTAYRLGASDFLVPVSWQSELPEVTTRIESKRARKGNAKVVVRVNAPSKEKVRPLATMLVCDAGKDKRQSIEALIKQRKELNLSATVLTEKAEEKAYFLHPKVIWLELSPDPQHALTVLANLKERNPDATILVSFDKADADLINASYRLGADDFLDVERWNRDFDAVIKKLQPAKKRGPWALFLVIILCFLAILFWFGLHH
jgi:DNA-binding NarL/FixJ family response regulator